MAVLGNLFFNRTLKQFLDCDDLTSDKGVALTEKIRSSAKSSIKKLIEVIPTVSYPHRDVLRDICVEHSSDKSEKLLFDSLGSDQADVRSTAADILSQSSQISAAKLFKKLQDSEGSISEIIDILSFQKESLRPEQIVNNALKLKKTDAERLLQLAEGSTRDIDLSLLDIVPSSIESPTIKIMLLRYFSTLRQREVSTIIAKFLTDDNKIIIIEALKALNNLKMYFDASVLLPFIETMTNVEREMAIEILQKQANAELVSRLAPWTTGKSDELREVFIKLVVKFTTQDSLEKFLLRLEQQEWWGRDQALKSLVNHGKAQLALAAKDLVEHDSDFVRSAAQLLASSRGDDIDLDSMADTAVHQNWQVREKSIAMIGSSGKRESLDLLRKAYDRWPDSAVAVLKAVKQLGFSKGLEIAFQCMKMPEALVQREALVTVASLASQQHAKNIRDTVLARVPGLQATVRDTAHEVLLQLTKDFSLSELKVADPTLFETRLVKLDGSQNTGKTVVSTSNHEATQVVNFLNIEELKHGDVWMGRFRIVKEVGRGAMGRVMLAEDEMVGEQLILKFMHPELTADGASRERFLREVKYSRKVSHANVIRIHDMLFKNGLCAISMEYFESKGVDTLLDEIKSFEPEPGLDILLQIASGMSAAHKQNVIHRDLKPSNVMMNDQGLVKVVDFGIASASYNSESTLTKTGSIIGTPAYLSPERAKGLEADYRCDIYALGVVAYRMFSGQLPYKGEPMSILFQHLEGNAKPLHELNRKISASISLLVQKMMAVEAGNRIQTMDDVCDAIQDAKKKR
jgi:tRNA A-37 threonylcarbamoyl transferase component Bud32